jgi:hypothetical protein
MREITNLVLVVVTIGSVGLAARQAAAASSIRNDRRCC